ncbi:hypothetical protein [Streptoalloteichus hindustanus]|uniref:PPE family protein n=1 Tax=Streptoalloteichus hindustanus TaxID=2017 RepID=A0A1M5NPX1_STRHI|nr:hypothetical protein [Streptoalloteichus hindustanus]SHG91572.1 hypothetical protein SAMN05444320_11669 [Streptoalloteichus hindustanus]
MHFGVGYYRYEGFDLETKVRWVKQEGAGLSVLEDNTNAVRGLTEALYQSENNLRRVLGQIGVAWEGSGANAATAAMGQATKWAAEAGDMSQASGQRLDQQTTTASHTKNAMPEVVAKPEYGFDDLLGDVAKVATNNAIDVQTNFDKQVAARRAADEAANRVLEGYESSSRSVLQSLQPLPEPPKITVEAASGGTPPPSSSVDSWQSRPTGRRNTVVSPRGEENRPPTTVTPPPSNRQDGSLPPAITPPNNFPTPVPIEPGPAPKPTPPPPPGWQPSPNPTPFPPPGVQPPFQWGQRPGEQPVQRGGQRGGPGGGGLPGGGRAGGAGAGAGGGVRAGGFPGAGGPGEGGRGPWGRGPLSGGVIGEAGPGARGGAAGAPGRGGSIMQPAVGGAHGAGGGGEEDGEHTDKYAEQTDEHFLGGLPMVAPPVIGGNPPGQP